jgi:hypothetical protein
MIFVMFWSICDSLVALLMSKNYVIKLSYRKCIRTIGRRYLIPVYSMHALGETNSSARGDPHTHPHTHTDRRQEQQQAAATLKCAANKLFNKKLRTTMIYTTGTVVIILLSKAKGVVSNCFLIS